MLEYKSIKTKSSDLGDILNEHAQKGWVFKSSVSRQDHVILIFEREKSKHMEELNEAVDSLTSAVASSFTKK